MQDCVYCIVPHNTGPGAQRPGIKPYPSYCLGLATEAGFLWTVDAVGGELLWHAMASSEHAHV